MATIQPGVHLGPYEILSQIGEGGMGQVWKARDTRLDRNVAIKVSKEKFSERFGREARAVAALNHPNICTLHDVGPNYLVMEMVEGPTIAERLQHGPIPLDEAIVIARQIGSALEAAHEKAIIHRDLKPGNIKITPSGTVKVLDFGLAKMAEGETNAATNTDDTPTFAGATETNAAVVCGTPAYMAPEQARGTAVDKRADIWAFGAVLYQMITGRPAFDGESVSDIVASVLTKEPGLERTPPQVRRLLRSCLKKNPRHRLRDIGDAWELLEQGGPETNMRKRRTPWIAATLLLTVVAAVAAIGWWRAAKSIELPLQIPMRLDFVLGPDVTIGSSIGPTAALSPDATRVVFVSAGPDGTARLSMRRLDESKAAQLPGTDGAYAPFFSPDGEWVGFFARGRLKKIRLDGGQPITLCDAPSGRGASWSEDGNIIAALDPRVGLSRIPADGGKPVDITEREPGEISHRWPYVLPGGKNVLFTMTFVPANYNEASIAVVSLEDQRKKIILERGGLYARYVPTGHIIYVTKGTLFAVPFDLSRMEVRGAPKPVLEDVSNDQALGFAQVALSQRGTLMYHRGRTEALRTLWWLGADGKTESLKAEPALYNMMRVSPDGGRLAVSVAEGSSADIWVHDLERGPRTRLTAGPGVNASPVWSPDGRSVVFQSQGGISWVSADGAEKPQLVIKSPRPQTPASFTPDGDQLIFFEQVPGGGAFIQAVPFRRNSNQLEVGKPKLLLQTPTGNPFPALSPDGRWLAYASSESGVYEVYVRAFPDRGAQWQISTGGGNVPRWSRNRNELFYQSTEDQRIMFATYSVKGDSFVGGSPRLWSPRQVARFGIAESFDPTDGRRLLVMLPADNPEPLDTRSHVTVILNFLDQVRGSLFSEAR